MEMTEPMRLWEQTQPWPNQIESLHLCIGLNNANFDAFVLPASLKSFKLWFDPDYSGRRFTRSELPGPLILTKLPPKLTKLKANMCHFSKTNNVTLPLSLVHLSFHYHTNPQVSNGLHVQSVLPQLSAQISALPHLLYFESERYTQNIDLPRSLRGYRGFSNHSTKHVDSIRSLTLFTLVDHYLFPLPPPWPIHLHTLVIEKLNIYHLPRLQNLPHSLEVLKLSIAAANGAPCYGPFFLMSPPNLRHLSVENCKAEEEFIPYLPTKQLTELHFEGLFPKVALVAQVFTISDTDHR
jgi:hypothetical protein